MAASCIFCKIARKEDPKTVIEYESDSIVIFKDISPASDFHFLAIPKTHIRDSKSLESSHLALLQEMREQLKILIRNKVPDLTDDDLSLGFHWPPFNSIAHLHMHGIAPVSKMGFLQRQIYRKNSWWYRQADGVIDNLQPRPN